MDSHFQRSSVQEPHRARTQAILRAHPEVRLLFGKNPYTFALILGIVGLQFAVAAALQGAAWWVVLLTAYALGAVADHALFVLIHECAHHLLFRRRTANMLSGILANLPMVLPSSVSFSRYHLRHHAFQGVHELDADLPSHWETRVVGQSPITKALWLMLFPVVLITRALRLKEVRIVDGWLVCNLLAMLAVDVLVYWLWGGTALAYLFASFTFSVGLHPLGARWIQEHFMVESPQETYSYYGPANTVALNVGFHNEHHDFPSIPWNRLPRLKSLAADWYDSLACHRSWTRLLFRFLFDRQLLLTSRMVRSDRGNVPVPVDEYRPELSIAVDQTTPTRRAA